MQKIIELIKLNKENKLPANQHLMQVHYEIQTEMKSKMTKLEYKESNVPIKSKQTCCVQVPVEASQIIV